MTTIGAHPRGKDYDTHWQPPGHLKGGRERWQWTEDIILDGERWLQNQPFWTDLVRAENVIKGKEMDQADENRSDLTSNRLKRIGREMVATCADVRYPADIWTSDNADRKSTLLNSSHHSISYSDFCLKKKNRLD